MRRSVHTGLTSEGRIEVLSGLESGDTIVVTGNNTLRDGAQVRVVAGPGAEAPARSGAPASPDTSTGGGES